jgi:CYTH domain-containing protein
MFELIMTYCLVGQPCAVETVANFPQYDVGQHICEIAKPAIEMGVRERAPRGTRVTFKCQEAVGGAPVEYEYQIPRQSQPDLLEQVLPRLMQEAQRYVR